MRTPDPVPAEAAGAPRCHPGYSKFRMSAGLSVKT